MVTPGLEAGTGPARAEHKVTLEDLRAELERAYNIQHQMGETAIREHEMMRTMVAVLKVYAGREPGGLAEATLVQLGYLLPRGRVVTPVQPEDHEPDEPDVPLDELLTTDRRGHKGVEGVL